MSDPSWIQVSAVNPESLADARLQLHWAAQTVMAVGNAWIPAQRDDSQTSLEWSPAHEALLGQPLPTGVRAGLRPATAALLVVAAGDKQVDELALDGRQLNGAFTWMARAIHTAAAGTDAPLVLADYDMPAHPVSEGRPFDTSDLASFAEIGRWFAGAHAVLGSIASAEPHATPVRCWPHHFDIATLIQFDPDEAGASRSIGVGMSPGDASYDQPYYYANPWPAPEPRPALPDLPAGGRWHGEGWFGAVLTGSALVDGSDDDQADRLLCFLDASIAANRALLIR